MALCKSCGKSLTLLNKATQDLCNTCVSSGHTKTNSAAPKKAEIEAIMLTTEAYPQGLTITRRIEVVTAECAFGMNIFKDLFAGVRDIVGGRSEAVQKTLRDSRRVALYELKKEAHAVGANAVVGVDLDYVELSAAGSMVLLVASGTAVTVETVN
jgi:uncharacterized protein YbjQ (UPF0145 family)